MPRRRSAYAGRAGPGVLRLGATPTNLPLQLTIFVGRDLELADVKRLQGAQRLLTLTGASGVGKTRLALQAASEVQANYPDGVWFVPLAALQDPALLPRTVASMVGVGESRGQSINDTLAGFLKTKRLLLVLDNCEHLVDACVELIDQLLRACPTSTS